MGHVHCTAFVNLGFTDIIIYIQGGGKGGPRKGGGSREAEFPDEAEVM